MTKLSELFEIYPAHPRATMPVGIRVDNWLYGSVSGIDPVSGRFEGDMPAQMRASAAAMKHVLERGGMQPSDVRTVLVICPPDGQPDLTALHRLLGANDESSGSASAPNSPSNATSIQVYTDPEALAHGQQISIDFTANNGDSDWTPEMWPAGTQPAPDAVKLGPMLWVPALTGADPLTGRLSDGIEAQVVAALDNLERLLERTGVGRQQVLRIAGYMRDLKDKDLLNNAMVDRFPVWAEKPVHKYVPCALPPGVEFALEVIAVEGGPRRILEIEGIKHNDPISLGAQVGNAFVSSRVQARLEPTAREQAARLIESHARRLVEHIGGSLEDVTQLVWGIGDPAFEADVRAASAEVWPGTRMPQLDVMQADFPHSPLPRLEFFALIG